MNTIKGKADAGREILLADDDPVLLELIALALAEKGHKVTTVTSGEAALRNLCAKTFQVVITDLFMPKVDGFEVLQKAKELDSKTIVIVITGNSDPSFAARARQSNADDYLLKPFRLSHLCNRITRFLEETGGSS